VTGENIRGITKINSSFHAPTGGKSSPAAEMSNVGYAYAIYQFVHEDHS
jgi:hypothetical protein